MRWKCMDPDKHETWFAFALSIRDSAKRTEAILLQSDL